MADYRSLFIEPPPRQWVSGPGGSGEWRIKPTGFLDDEQDSRFPTFQDAWKRSAGLTDLFGPNPFTLHGTVAPSGGDNHRADVAKVQAFLGRTGYLDLGSDGPSGYPTDQTDDAIRRFQKDKGLTVDGILKPGGPTISALGGLLGGASAPMPKPARTTARTCPLLHSPASPRRRQPATTRPVCRSTASRRLQSWSSGRRRSKLPNTRPPIASGWRRTGPPSSATSS